MKLAYADPPYPGQSAKHYSEHPDYAGEVDHAELVARLEADYDGWILHTSSTALREVWSLAPSARLCIWVKTFCAFKANVPLAYAYEPVLVRRLRKQVTGGGVVMRDWIACPMAMARGVVGAKPDEVVEWALRCAGAERDDDVDDLYPGSGAVGRCVDRWRARAVLL